MGKLKVVAEVSDPELVVGLAFERTDATFMAGENIAGIITFHASQPFECDAITLTLKAEEQVRGTHGQQFEWCRVLFESETPIDHDPCEQFSVGTHSLPFTIALDPAVPPTFMFETPNIGDHSQIKLSISYIVYVTFDLRNSTKVQAKAAVVIKRNPVVVWPASLPSVSIDDSIAQLVRSPMSGLCCWQRGETCVSATIHNRTVDIESGVIHVRVLIVNRSAFTVNSVRLCLVVNVALYPERPEVAEADNVEEDGTTSVHAVDLLTATDPQATSVVPGASAHLNLEMEVKRVAHGLLFEQEMELEPSMRSQYLEISYCARVEVCHAKGGSTVSLDLPLVLVPLASDVLPPADEDPLAPIRGRGSHASTAHDDEETEVKSHFGDSRVSSMELWQPQSTSLRADHAGVSPLHQPVERDCNVSRRDIHIDVPSAATTTT